MVAGTVRGRWGELAGGDAIVKRGRAVVVHMAAGRAVLDVDADALVLGERVQRRHSLARVAACFASGRSIR